MEWLIILGVSLYFIYRFWKTMLKWLVYVIVIGGIFLVLDGKKNIKLPDIKLNKTELIGLLK